MSTPERHELIHNAVAFLADPKTQGSPLAQRVQFLEAKGLTSAEIDEALKRAGGSQMVPLANYAPPYPPAYGPSYGPAYPRPPWDWRDYFIAAVVGGTVVSGAVALARKYLLPHLQPPEATAYEMDRDALTAQFDAVEAMLKEMQADTAAVRQAVDEQQRKVDQATEEVQAAVAEMREGESKARDGMREIREEVNNIREMLPKMIEKNKESQTHSLGELQQELKSLKALLLSRGPSFSSSPASPLPALAARPSIPSWQLAGMNPPASTSNPGTPLARTPAPVEDKGKTVGDTVEQTPP